MPAPEPPILFRQGSTRKKAKLATAAEVARASALVTSLQQGAMSSADKDKLDAYAGTWRSGSGAPNNAVGINGDLYLRTSNGDVYLRSAGTYSIIGNLKGPAGAAGATGATGPAGTSGSNFNFRGEYAPTGYEPWDVVHYTNDISKSPAIFSGTYVCTSQVVSSSQNPQQSPELWYLLARDASSEININGGTTQTLGPGLNVLPNGTYSLPGFNGSPLPPDGMTVKIVTANGATEDQVIIAFDAGDQLPQYPSFTALKNGGTPTNPQGIWHLELTYYALTNKWYSSVNEGWEGSNI